MNNKTILIVDDTISNLDVLCALLDEYDVIPSTNAKEAYNIIAEIDIDLILLDIMMPEIDGYEVCERLKNDSTTKDIPIVFITAKTDEDSIEKAYDVGGSDYISKPFKPKELLARVKRELKLQELQNELKLLASTDPMTKLYNRRHFTSISEHTLELAKRSDQELSLIMLDIDKFKTVNDTYGHQVGDEVIIALANKLISLQRKSDVICRYGGEEFVILLPNTSKEDATQVAESIRVAVASLIVPLNDSKKLQFTISLGVSSVLIKEEKNIEVALKRADDALYKAKESGRNRVC